jgi:hypothetical protein
MLGLVPGIHVLRAVLKTWMAGSSPAMTMRKWRGYAGPVAIGGPFSWPHSDHEPS